MAPPAGQFRPWRKIGIFVGITGLLFGLIFITPGSNSPKLGIDLQGGTRITLTARTTDNSAPSRDQMNQAREIMQRRVNGSGVAGAQVQIDGSSQLVVTVPGTEDLTNLARSAQLNLRPVITQQGQLIPSTATGSPTATGTSGTSGASGTSAATTTPTTSATASASTDIATATATSPATTSPATTSAASTAPVVDFPSEGAPNNPTQPAASTAEGWASWQNAMTTAIQSGLTCAQIAPYEGIDDKAKPLVACDRTGTIIYLLDATLIPGDQIDTATSQLAPTEGWVVLLKFKSQGFTDWAAYTTQNIGKQTAFALDGKVIVAPTIQGSITTDTQITGNFTQRDAVDLANALKFGALPLAFERSSSDSVTAELGLSYLRAGLIAGGIGLLLVVIYCLIYYRLLGLITILSLVLSFGLVYAVMVLLGRWINLSLDMAGVAGLIIAIGITADSFVVYFERIKDEVREGRTFRSAVPRGWTRAIRTILAADAVSFLAAGILYMLAVGEVRGFAFTLGLSTVLDLVVVYLVTHPMVALASGAKIFSLPRWSGLGAVADAGAQQRAEINALTVKGSVHA